MVCEPIVNYPSGGKKRVVGWICWQPTFEFEGFLFEWHSYHGPAQVNRRNGEIRTTVDPGFYAAMERFNKLTVEEKAAYAHAEF